MKHDGQSGLAGWIRATWLPYLERIPKPQRKEFIIELVKRYIQEYPPNTDGKIHVQMIRLEVEAAKNS